jgi:hypothetical protein
MLAPEQLRSYAQEGVLVIPGFFSSAEVGVLHDHAHRGERALRHAANMPDAAGRSSRLSLWGNLGNDVFSAVSAHPRMVGCIEALLGEPCYHWHSKVMLKEPLVGGAWEWHQDYGYWYGDHCLFPRLMSCLVALDRADRDNGCLKVLVGSHHLGRIDHGSIGSQHGANPARVQEAAKQLELRYLEVDPGTAVFFHCNTLHASEANLSARERTSYICCYNARSNAPSPPTSFHGQPEPIQLADPDGIMKSLLVGT